MKITFFTKIRMPEERGVSFAIASMCRGFKESGSEVELIIPNRRQNKNFENIDFWKYYQLPRDLFKVTKIWCLDLPDWSILKKFKYLVMSWTFSFSAVLFIYKNKISYAHLFNECREIAFLLKACFFVKPFVTFEVHILPQIQFEKLLEKMFLSRVNLLFSTTHQFANYYIEQGFKKDKVLVYPNGINLKDFDYSSKIEDLRKRLGLPLNKTIIGFGGRFITADMEKGIPELIEAVEQLRSKYKNIFLLCVGGPRELVYKYQKMAVDKGISNACLFIDHVAPKILYEYMRVFDICAMPFPWTSHFAFAMSPLKMFEYMASKHPILATDLPVVKEVLKNNVNAVLVKPSDPKSLAKGIGKLLENKSLARKISTQAFKEVSTKYTWAKRQAAVIAKAASLYNGQFRPK